MIRPPQHPLPLCFSVGNRGAHLLSHSPVAELLTTLSEGAEPHLVQAEQSPHEKGVLLCQLISVKS